ncbi:hypothetical protein BLA29_005060 [Euroglyphus maynei]|uniref:Uncharacterized protein n=1 Tax=Euroglyphus maynei TaxID=6958 RepID=A0A1Y3BTB7_EURMA|nr:hypothetical protein BLA29_005060 [Euroglyphus maynei]
MALNHHVFTIICLTIFIGNKLSDSLTLKQKPFDSDYIDIDDESNANLFYADDDELSTEKTPTSKQATMRQVMREILRDVNVMHNEKCLIHKDHINELCLAKFYQRSRLHYDLTTITKNDNDEADDIESIPSAQQNTLSIRRHSFIQIFTYSPNTVMNVDFNSTHTIFSCVFE